MAKETFMISIRAENADRDAACRVGAPLQLQNVRIDFPIVQAALSGYSDWPMRLLARRLGAGYAVCEVMLDKFLVEVKERARTRHFLYQSDDERPVGGQLMGAEPEQFSAGATKLVEAGFDVIDINFGCPVKKVLGRCRGGFHLGQPSVALEIIQRTREAVPDHIPVTVKMRRGIDDSQESCDKFFTILEGAYSVGVAAVTVHGRTVQQRYVGPSRWEFLAEVKRFAGQRIVLGSGDLFTAAACLEMMAATGVDGVTVARGAIGNPWIFAQARELAAGRPLPPPPSLHEQAGVMREHYELAEQLYGPQRCGPLMRKFGTKYATNHPCYEDVRQWFARVRDRTEWEAAVQRWYAADGPGCYPDPALHRSQGE
jgi:nifR3 family TIM-barrel protein